MVSMQEMTMGAVTMEAVVLGAAVAMPAASEGLVTVVGNYSVPLV